MKLNTYLLELLGESDFNQLNRVLRDGKTIIVNVEALFGAFKNMFQPIGSFDIIERFPWKQILFDPVNQNSVFFFRKFHYQVHPLSFVKILSQVRGKNNPAPEVTRVEMITVN